MKTLFVVLLVVGVGVGCFFVGEWYGSRPTPNQEFYAEYGARLHGELHYLRETLKDVNEIVHRIDATARGD